VRFSVASNAIGSSGWVRSSAVAGGDGGRVERPRILPELDETQPGDRDRAN
jgi:hypothetical protein